MSNIINLTPHDITIDANGDRITIEASGAIARLITPSPEGKPVRVSGFTLPTRQHVGEGALDGLPDPVEGTFFVVSALCLDAARRQGRTDVLAPGTGPKDGAIREGGRIVAITRFVRA